MTSVELVTAWAESHLTGDWKKYDELTADDFQLLGPAPEPLSKQQFLEWAQNLLAAAPDLSNNFEITDHSENSVKGWLQMKGTNTGDWNLAFMGLGNFPATGRPFKNPREKFDITCRDGQIIKCDVVVPEGSGITGIFAQLGLG